MLAQAGIDLAPREVEIATKGPQPSFFLPQSVRSGNLFGALQVGEGAVEILCYPLHPRAADPGTATLAVAAGRILRFFECFEGGCHVPEVMSDFAKRIGEFMTFLLIAGDG
jgi:hypothetical protein